MVVTFAEMYKPLELIFLFIFSLLCAFSVVKTMPATANRSGPFESITERAAPCAKWTKPIDKDPPVILNVELYNTSSSINLMRGNVTILKDCKNKRIRAKGFFWQGGKWKLVYLMNNMGCNSFFMPIMSAILGVKYDHKNCIFFKGQYTFDNLDTNKTEHLFNSVQDYGRILWRDEFFSEVGSAFCWEFETVVKPIGQQ